MFYNLDFVMETIKNLIITTKVLLLWSDLSRVTG